MPELRRGCYVPLALTLLVLMAPKISPMAFLVIILWIIERVKVY